MKQRSLVPYERVQISILNIREQRVILDSDLAALYGVPTKRLNEQVRRNHGRFPSDFMFKLTKKEKDEVVAKCDHLSNLKFSRTRPYAFTEHGAIMAANVVNSDRAVDVGVQVVRAFVRLRKLVLAHEELATELGKLEKRVNKQDKEIRIIFRAIKHLMKLEPKPKVQIGFRSSQRHVRN